MLPAFLDMVFSHPIMSTNVLASGEKRKAITLEMNLKIIARWHLF